MLFLVDRVHQRSGFGVLFNIQPLVGNLATSQEVFNGVGGGRPERTGYPYAIKGDFGGGQPIAEEVIQNGVQILFRGLQGFIR